MTRLLPTTIALLLTATLPCASRAATVPLAGTAAAPSAKQLDAQIATRQSGIAALTKQIQALDNGIQNRVTKTVDELENLGDSKDSGTRVARIKEDVIDFLRKQITDYARRRAQLRAELDNPQRVIPIATLNSDIAKIDARIDQRIDQVVALGGSFAQHQDYDRYESTGSNWRGGTEYRVNEDWKQNRKTTQKGSQQTGKLVNALDETIRRLEFSNRSLKSRLAAQSGPAAERTQADIAQNEARIETLRGKRVTLLTGSGRVTRGLTLKEALAIADRLKGVGSDIRRDQTKLTGYYHELNAECYQLALLDAQKTAAAKPRP